jgi:polyphosphate kinase
MGFVSAKETKRFLSLCPEIEKCITDAGIILIKFWLEVALPLQRRRSAFQTAALRPKRKQSSRSA